MMYFLSLFIFCILIQFVCNATTSNVLSNHEFVISWGKSSVNQKLSHPRVAEPPAKTIGGSMESTWSCNHYFHVVPNTGTRQIGRSYHDVMLARRVCIMPASTHCAYMILPTYLPTLVAILCSLVVADVSLDVRARTSRPVEADDEWLFDRRHSSIWT